MLDKIKKGAQISVDTGKKVAEASIDASIKAKDQSIKYGKKFIRKKALDSIKEKLEFAQKKETDFSKEQLLPIDIKFRRASSKNKTKKSKK